MAEIPSAVEWARTVEPERMRLADLDAHLLRFDEDALHALGRRRIDDRGGPARRRRRARDAAAGERRGRWRTVLLVLASLVVLCAPAAGLAVVIADGRIWLQGSAVPVDVSEPLDVELAFPIAGACFVVSTLLALAPLAAWLRRGRIREAFDVGLALVIALLAGLAIPPILRRSVEGGDAALALVPAATATTVGVVVALVILVGSARRVRGWFPTIGEPDVAAAATAIGVLPEGAQQGLRDERAEALGVLAERGLVDAALRRRADEAPLGSLVALDRG